MSQLGH